MKFCIETIIRNGILQMPEEIKDFFEDPNCVVTRGLNRNDHNTLFLFNTQMWEDFDNNFLSKLKMTDPTKNKWRRAILLFSADLIVDTENMTVSLPESTLMMWARKLTDAHKVKFYYEDDAERKHFTIEFLSEDYRWRDNKSEFINNFNFFNNSLAKTYVQTPRSYFLTADAGFGKTTILKHFSNILQEKEIYDSYGQLQTLVVIYISMYDINMLPSVDIEKGPIIELLRKENIFNHSIDHAGIYEMIKKDTTYRYVFLLDGINEVQNRILGTDSIYSIIETEIMRLMTYTNVDVIASARSEKILSNRMFVCEDGERATLKVVRLTGMRQVEGTPDKKRIVNYLNTEEGVIPDDLWEELECPMLLSYYKQILHSDKFDSELKQNIRCKTDLLDCYYDLDIMKNTDDIKVNQWDNIRREHLLKWVLPGIAFDIEGKMLSLNNENDTYVIDTKSIFYDVCNQYEQYYPDIPGGRENLWNGLIRLQICDEKGKFIHDIIREYWASKGLFLRMYYSHKDEDIKIFFDDISLNIIRGKDSFEIARQTRHIGLIEIIYEMIQNKTPGKYDYLCSQYAMARKGSSDAEVIDYRTMFELFVHYMSMLDDLHDSDMAAEVGWFAYDGIPKEKREAVFEWYENNDKAYYLVKILNDMGYSTNNSSIIKNHLEENDAGNPNALTLLQNGIDIVDKMLLKEIACSDYEKNKLYVLKGKLLNNIGAYYYGRDEYYKADSAYKAAFEYRKNKGLDLSVSYKVISSNYFQIGELCKSNGNIKEAMQMYKKANEIFKEYLWYKTKKEEGRLCDGTMLFSEFREDYYNLIDKIMVINVIGSQIEIIKSCLHMDDTLNTIEELVHEIICELKYCNDIEIQKSRRTITDTEERLNNKKKDLIKLLKTIHVKESDELRKLCGGVSV